MCLFSLFSDMWRDKWSFEMVGGGGGGRVGDNSGGDGGGIRGGGGGTGGNKYHRSLQGIDNSWNQKR